MPMTMVDLNHWQRHNGPIESFYFFEFFKPINEPRSNFNLVLLGNGLDSRQSYKNPVIASSMLTGKFLQIRKVFVTISLLAEEFPDTLQYKISR